MLQTAFYERMVMGQPDDYDRSKLRLEFGANNSNSSNFLNSSKKRRLMPHAMPSPALLQSPDLKLLKLGSPELERLIMNNNGFIPTPTPGQLPSFGNGEGTDPDRLALGFIEALQKLQDKDSTISKTASVKTWGSSVGTTSIAGGSIDTLNLPKSSSIKVPLQQSTTNSSPRWSANYDQNKNSVGVITPVIQNRTFLDEPSRLSPSPNLIQASKPPLNLPSPPTSTMYQPTTNSYTDLTRPLEIAASSHSQIPKQELSNSPNNWHVGPMSNASSGHMMSASNSPMMLDGIKAEDETNQIVPSMSVGGESSLLSNFPTNPINLAQQEHIKHERKKLRNRLAAQRCRKRKIEREDTLKDQVSELKDKNSELSDLASKLRMQVCELKQQVMQHVNEGCKLFIKDDVKEEIPSAASVHADYQVL